MNGMRNWWLCPLTIAAVGTKQVVGMATWLLTIRDMMTLFAASSSSLLEGRPQHSYCSMIATLLIRW